MNEHTPTSGNTRSLADPAGQAVDRNPTGKTFVGHPRMLAHLFSVEMWERFSFYGMQALVLYYMYYQVQDGGLGIDQSVAVGVVGAYGGTVYLCAILGGWVADRLIGPERTMLFSAVLIMLGHIFLSLIPAVPGLVLGLLCVAVGSGGLKTTSVNLVGSLYDLKDTKRDAGFTLYYMGVNIGALVGPALTGLAWKGVGFHLGFGIAAIGMAIGLVQYVMSRKELPSVVHRVPNPLPRSQYGKWAGIAAGGLVLILILVFTGLMNPGNLDMWVLGVVIVATVTLFAIILSDKDVTGDEHSRVISFIPMYIATAAFFSLFQQQFTVIAVYADTRMNLDIFGWTMPPSWVQMINPVLILAFGTAFTAMWTKLGNRQPRTPVKFALALLLIGVAFLTFLTQVSVAKVSVLWIVLILLFATLGELMISPVGLSLATKLSPRKYGSMMIALYMLSVSLGTTMAGTLAGFYSADSETPYFGTLGAITLGLGVAMLLLSGWTKRRMRGVP